MKSFKTLIICMYCNYGSKHFKIFNVCLSLIYFTLHIAYGMFSWKISVFTSVFISLLSCLAKPIMFNLLYIFSVIKLHARINTNSRCFENQSVEKYQGCFDNRFLCLCGFNFYHRCQTMSQTTGNLYRFFLPVILCNPRKCFGVKTSPFLTPWIKCILFN